MRNIRVQLMVIAVAFACLVAVGSLAARIGRGQSAMPKTRSTVKPAVRITDRNTKPASNASALFAPAAAQNALLKNELLWTFGGKQQHGWYLYDSLIAKTLDTQTQSVTTDFAAALAAWQKQKTLNPSGVLDEDSLMAMIAEWQDRRLKNRTYADPGQLLTVSSSDFYDPERLPELRLVERNTYEAYKKMVAAAVSDSTLKLSHSTPGELAHNEKYFKIISAFRTRDYQEQLRRESPNAGSAGLAVNSPHFTGRALDIYVGGDPVDTRDSNRALQVKTPAYRWLVRNAERFGFRPYFYEPWHWEYVR